MKRRREQRRRYLLACEGDKEVAYFKYLGKAMGGGVKLVPVHRQPDPQHVVDLAIDERDKDRRAAKESGDVGDVYDGVWAVVDIDTHPHLSEAMTDAKRAGVDVAISGPCFETWLILHREDRTAAFNTPKAAKDHWAGLVGKVRTPDQEFAKLKGRLTVAIGRAEALAARHGSTPRQQRNPSSEVGALVTTICAESGIDPQTIDPETV